MLDIVIPAAIIVMVVMGALGGAGIGYWLSRESRTKRRRGVVAGIMAALVSPVLHGLAPIVWAGLAGSLVAYLAGRLAVSRGNGGYDGRDAGRG